MWNDLVGCDETQYRLVYVDSTAGSWKCPPTATRFSTSLTNKARLPSNATNATSATDVTQQTQQTQRPPLSLLLGRCVSCFYSVCCVLPCVRCVRCVGWKPICKWASRAHASMRMRVVDDVITRQSSQIFSCTHFSSNSTGAQRERLQCKITGADKSWFQVRLAPASLQRGPPSHSHSPRTNPSISPRGSTDPPGRPHQCRTNHLFRTTVYLPGIS